jgi:hypothetical protein
LKGRLVQAEKSVKIYQQKLVDALEETEPVKKELGILKTELTKEVRERSKYELEAEVSANYRIFSHLFLKIFPFLVSKKFRRAVASDRREK